MNEWKSERLTAAREAIELAGGKTALASKLNARYGALGLPLPGRSGFTPYQVQKWASAGVTHCYVLHVEAITGVSRHRLAPQTFGSEQHVCVA